MEPRFDNMDASESAFLARQLEQIKTQTYDRKFENLKARELVPVDHSINTGAEVWTYRQWDMVGMAKIIRDYATDLPRADVLAREFTQRIRSIATSYGYSVQEVRAAMFAGIPLEQKKANAARRMFEETVESIARTGDAANDLLGLLNQPNTNTYSVPNGSGGSPLWVNKISDEIAADLHGIANGIVSATREVEKPDTIGLPIAQYQAIATRRMSDGSDKTILQFFLETSPYIKTVFMWNALATAGSGSTTRMICYRRDPDALGLIIPQEFEMFPGQARNLEVVVPCHGRIGGVVMYYPLSMSYGDGI